MSNQKKPPAEPVPNGWGFGIEVIKGIFGLLNSGRIFPAFGILLLALVGLVIWRMPDKDLAMVAISFFDYLQSSAGVAYVLLAASNVGWYLLQRRTRQIYDKEMDRLAKIRSDLFHLGASQILIMDHRSSNGEQSESYILPDISEKNPKREQ